VRREEGKESGRGKNGKTHLDGRVVLAHPHPLSRWRIELAFRWRLLLDGFGEVGGRKEERLDGGNEFRGDLVIALDGEGAVDRKRVSTDGREG
jgi:hypothetical protein